MKSFRSALIVIALASFAFANGEASPLWDATVGAAPHVHGGKEVVPHSHPYHVLIFQPGANPALEGRCAGVLIAPQWVIGTAYGCRYRKKIVVLGKHRWNEETSNGTTQQRTVVERYMHKDYNSRYFAHDLALLKLDSPAILNQYVQPIRLPAVSQQKRHYYGSQVTVVGWGFPYGAGRRAEALQSFDSLVVHDETCAKHLRLPQLAPAYLCVDPAGGKSACAGDGGGPVVMVEKDGKPTLVGIINEKLTLEEDEYLCEERVTTVSARVDYYLDFIANTTGIPLRK